MLEKDLVYELLESKIKFVKTISGVFSETSLAFRIQIHIGDCRCGVVSKTEKFRTCCLKPKLSQSRLFKIVSDQ